MEKKMNNKGFSLVELIIVVAIMAVLVGVLAPQYMKYVEKSRNSTDRDNAAALESACMVWASDEASQYIKSKNATITVNATDATIAGENAAQVVEALKNAGFTVDASNKIKDLKCVSKQTFTSYTVTVTVKADGSVEVKTTES